jgi:hypothetical protein
MGYGALGTKRSDLLVYWVYLVPLSAGTPYRWAASLLGGNVASGLDFAVVFILEENYAYLLVTVAVRSEAWVLVGWLLGSWVRIPLKAWMFVRVFLCCVVLCR